MSRLFAIIMLPVLFASVSWSTPVRAQSIVCLWPHALPVSSAPVQTRGSVQSLAEGGGLATQTSSVLDEWVIVSGHVLGVGHWKDLVLKHRTGHYWVHASWAQLRGFELELGAKIRVFLPGEYSLEATQGVLTAHAVRVAAATWSTPVGRLRGVSTTLDFSSPSSLQVTVQSLGHRLSTPRSHVSPD